MTKPESIKSAQEKANLCCQNQVVFQQIQGTEILFDYTHESLWEQRHFRHPTVIKVVVVTPDTGRPRV